MRNLYESFEMGIEQSFKFVSQEEVAREACQLIGAFADPYASSIDRQDAIAAAGRYTGAIKDPSVANTLQSLFRRCATLRDGEVINLSKSDKAFIKAAIEGNLYRPFYE